MLKGISPIISPELLKLIAEMGHGDELVLADANFPGASIGKRCIRCDGHGCADVMRALLTLFPLALEHSVGLGPQLLGGGAIALRVLGGELFYNGCGKARVAQGQHGGGGGYRPADCAIRYDGS